MCQFIVSSAMSLLTNCKTHDDVNELWEKLSRGGEKGQCGWLKDKCGLSWQIVPIILGEVLQDKDARNQKELLRHYLEWISLTSKH